MPDKDVLAEIAVMTTDGLVKRRQRPSPTLRQLVAEALPASEMLNLAQYLTELVGRLTLVSRVSEVTNGTRARRLVIETPFSANWASVTVAGPCGDVDVVLTHDLDWHSARDQFFWHFAVRAAERDAALVLLARKASPKTVLVCKELGVRVVQYYSMLVPQGSIDTARKLSEQHGWFHSIPIDTLKSHAVNRLIERHIAAAHRIDREGLGRGLGTHTELPTATDGEWPAGSALERELTAASEVARSAADERESDRHPNRKARQRRKLGTDRVTAELFGRLTEVTRIGIKVQVQTSRIDLSVTISLRGAQGRT